MAALRDIAQDSLVRWIHHLFVSISAAPHHLNILPNNTSMPISDINMESGEVTCEYHPDLFPVWLGHNFPSGNVGTIT